MALNDFEKNVLGAREPGAPTFTPSYQSTTTAMMTPAKPVEKSFFKDNWAGKALSAVGNFGVGVAKGAADTLLSVPRNVEKVVQSAVDVSEQARFNKIRESINQQNDMLLAEYRKLPQGDPRKAKLGTLIQQNIDQFTALNDEEKAVRDQIKQDASWIPMDEGGQVQERFDDMMATKGKAQQYGFKAEKIGELIVPAGATAKADKALSGMKLLDDATKGGRIINAGARILAKGALEGATAAASTVGQAGYQGRLDTEAGRKGVVEDAKRNALFAGGAKMAFAGTGEVLKGTGLARKFASTTYKLDKKDFQKILENYGDELDPAAVKTMESAIGDTRRTFTTYQQGIAEGMDPARVFKNNTGVLADEAKGSLINDIANKMRLKIGGRLGEQKARQFINSVSGVDTTFDDLEKVARETLVTRADEAGESLADWAIRNELKGGVMDQAKQVAKKIADAENEVIKTAEASKIRIPVDKGLKSFADDFVEEYSKYGRGEVAKDAQAFLDDIADDGTVSVKNALLFRRTIDKVRSNASFRNPRVADNIKYWADDLRAAVNNSDGIGAINKEYAMALRAAEALMKKGVSEGNKQLVGAMEMFTAGIPVATDNPSLMGFGIVAGKRALNNPRFQMGAARTIQNLGDSTAKGVATRRILPVLYDETTTPSFEE